MQKLTSDTIVIKAKEGTKFILPPGSILNKMGEKVTGNFQLIIKEYLTDEAILLAGLHTMQNDSTALETGGMGTFLLLKDYDTLKINPSVPILISIPVTKANLKEDMQVFTAVDTINNIWQNTNRPFIIKQASWEWPHRSYLKNLDFNLYDLDFDKMKPGRKYRDGAKISGHKRLRNGFKSIRPNKTYETIVTKPDSFTININLKAKLRNWALRKNKFTNKYFDTTFQVKYDSTAYVGPVLDTKVFNCDRVYGILKEYITVTSSNNVKGGYVSAILLNSRVFIPFSSEIKPGVFELKIPRDEKMILFYTGVSNETLFLGKEIYQFSKSNKHISIAVNSVTEEQFKEATSIKKYFTDEIK